MEKTEAEVKIVTNGRQGMNLIKPVKKIFRDISATVQILETTADVLLNSPTYVDSPEVGFNGQIFRKKIFVELLRNIAFEVIVETGTYTGNTTGYMSKMSSLPVYSCELNKTLLSLAKKRLESIPNISFMLSDSREFLLELVKKEMCKKASFIYLDAHWGEELPLKEEIEIISDNWNSFVVMVDDFQVPNDGGYGYDNYGGEQVLSSQHFSKIFTKHNLIPFFPVLPSAQETGYKRGCVILVRQGDMSDKLRTMEGLAAAL